jgi:hypothetical protein
MSEIMDAANRVAASQLAAALIVKDASFPDTTTEGIPAAIKTYASVLEEIEKLRAKTPQMHISEDAIKLASGQTL